MNIKTLLTFATLSLVSLGANSTAFNMTGGGFQFTGDVYFDNEYNQAPGDNRGARGIANIIQIKEGSNIIWDATTEANELSALFFGYEIQSTVNLSESRFFESTGGFVRFWENPTGTFQATGNINLDVDAISSAPVWLDLVGVDITSGSILSPGGVDSNISAIGNLQVIGGTEASRFDTNTLVGGADLSFNASGDTLDTLGYTFSGSADVGGATVPSPNPLALMLIGGAVLLGSTRVIDTKNSRV